MSSSRLPLIGLGQLVASGSLPAGDIERAVSVAVRAVLAGLQDRRPGARERTG